MLGVRRPTCIRLYTALPHLEWAVYTLALNGNWTFAVAFPLQPTGKQWDEHPRPGIEADLPHESYTPRGQNCTQFGAVAVPSPENAQILLLKVSRHML